MFVRILTAVAALCFATAANAQVVFSTPASACVPDDNTIKYARSKVDVASVQHADKNTDPIVLTCMITPFDSAATDWLLGITYRDSTGRNAQAVVRARLYTLAKGTAETVRAPAVAGIASPESIAVVTSDTSTSTTNNTLETAFTNTFDFSSFIYFVRIDIQRKSTGQTAILHSVTLTAPF